MDFIDHRSAATFKFGLSATDEKLRITSDGNVGIGLTNPSTKLEVDGVITTAGLTTTANVSFGDNDKAIFGAGSDLQIYHDGSHSYVSDQGTGRLYVQGSDAVRLTDASAGNMLSAIAGDGVYAYYNTALKLATTSAGIDVTGSVSADGLRLDAANSEAIIGANASYQGKIKYNDGTGELEFRNTFDSSLRGYAFYRGSTDKTALRLDGNGDISFYEDTGTTAKLFWDASAESLGIGTGSPNALLSLSSGSGTKATIETTRNFTVNRNFQIAVDEHAEGTLTITPSTTLGGSTYTTPIITATAAGNVGIGNSNPQNKLDIEQSAAVSARLLATGATSSSVKLEVKGGATQLTTTEILANSSGALTFATGTTSSAEQMRIDSSGNVGIGTSSPADTFGGSGTLDASGPLLSRGAIGQHQTNAGVFQYLSNATAIRSYGATAGSGEIIFGTGGGGGSADSEAMRIDASGSLLVGKASTAFGTAGVEASVGNGLWSTRSSLPPLALNRLSTDGSIADFYKDGTPVGSIGTVGGNIYAGKGGSGLIFNDGGTKDLIPYSLTASDTVDNSISLGISSKRFKDLYLSGGAYLGGVASANLLDDYEEGTFTPEFIATGGNPTVTYDTTVGNVGTYVKIGKVCHFQINIRTDSVSGGSGDLKVSGLPFTSKSGTGQIGISTAAIRATGFASNTPRVATISEGVTVVNLMTRTSITGDDSPTAVSALATGADSNLLRITGTYEVA